MNWHSYVMAIWLLGVMLFGTAALYRYRKLRQRLFRESRYAAFRLDEELKWACRISGLRRLPRVLISEQLPSAAVFGLSSPAAVIPCSHLDKVSREDLGNILLHEFTHIRRRDLLVHYVAVTILIVYWFNPLLWLVRRRVQELSELCCDAAVANSLGERVSRYRASILKAAEFLLGSHESSEIGVLGLLEGKSRLAERLRWLEKLPLKQSSLRIAALAVVGAFMLVAVLPMNRAAEEDTTYETYSIISAHTTIPYGQDQAYLQDLQLEFRKEGECRRFRGHYRKNDSQLFLNEPSSSSSDRTPVPKGFIPMRKQSYRNRPNFLREEEVLGFRTLVLASGHTAGGHYLESYRAPALRFAEIRSVHAGSWGISIQEPLVIEVDSAMDGAFRPRPDIDPEDEDYGERIWEEVPKVFPERSTPCLKNIY